MLQIGILTLTVVLYLATFAFGIFIFYHQLKEKSLLHAVVGFFIAPYGYFWAWFNSRRLEIIDVMVAGTIVTLMAFGFPLIMTFQSAANNFANMEESSFVVSSSSDGTTKVGDDGSISFSTGINYWADATPMGTIGLNQPVQGSLEGFSDRHDWSFSGQANQTVTIRVNAVGGLNPDPRVGIIDANGDLLIEDDDSGTDFNALIPNFRLPDSGSYTIRVDGWNDGRYELIIN